MRTIRIFTPQALESGTHITLEKDPSHHLKTVLRLVEGDSIHLFNDTGKEYAATLSKINKKDIEVLVGDEVENHSESPLTTIMILCISKGERVDQAIQKSVELGVNEIYPVISDRSNVKLDAERAEKKHRHWKNIIINASEQCGRTRLAKLHPVTHLIDTLSRWNTGMLIYADPASNETLSNVNTERSLIGFVVGPEGGLSERELSWLETKQDTAGIRFGPRIMRTETAPVAILAVLQFLSGDFSAR
jgi:16S rRNA (uracil1498-N3)-methyltransferase